MMPSGFDPGKMSKMMKQLGMETEELDASKVIIQLDGKELVIKDPKVVEIDMKGQKSYQVMGEPEKRDKKTFTDADVDMVTKEAHVSEKQAVEALKKHEGDIAEAIMELKD